MTEQPAQSVLLVDDDQFLRSMYARKFSEQHYEVVPAGTADEALKLLRDGAVPAIIVFDVVMPGMDGFGFLEAMRTENLAPQALKIALTNQSKPEDQTRAAALGAGGYFVKAERVPSETVAGVIALAREKKT